jgi:hypothetical protein
MLLMEDIMSFSRPLNYVFRIGMAIVLHGHSAQDLQIKFELDLFNHESIFLILFFKYT